MRRYSSDHTDIRDLSASRQAYHGSDRWEWTSERLGSNVETEKFVTICITET